MGFSDKMRDSLGAEGARVEVMGLDQSVPPGSVATTTVVIHGGTRPARVDALRVRLIRATRSWTDRQGNAITEEQVAGLGDKSHLMPAWTQDTVAEVVVPVDREIDPGASTDIPVEVAVPAECGVSSESCVVTLNAQADIKGQIDPSGNARLSVG